MTVAAYRDHYQISSDLPLGGGTTSDAQRADRKYALRAAREAASIATNPSSELRLSASMEVPTVSAP